MPARNANMGVAYGIGGSGGAVLRVSPAPRLSWKLGEGLALDEWEWPPVLSFGLPTRVTSPVIPVCVNVNTFNRRYHALVQLPRSRFKVYVLYLRTSCGTALLPSGGHLFCRVLCI